MEIKGEIVLSLGLESGTSKSGRTWQKASIVIETEGQYPKKVLLTNFKDAANFAALQVGTKGSFQIEIESRDWKNANTGKVSWFTEVSCWKWETEANAVPQANGPYAASGMPAAQAVQYNPQPSEQSDNLPF